MDYSITGLPIFFFVFGDFSGTKNKQFPHILETSYFIDLGFIAESPDRRPLKGTLMPEKKRLNCLASILSVVSGGNQAPPIICQIPSLWWSMVVAASCFGGVFQWQGLDHWSVLREAGRSKIDISLTKTWSIALRMSDWVKGSPSNRTSPSAHSQDSTGVA